MSDLYEKIVSQRGSLENLVAKIPGFRGYQEGAARRQADTMIRDHIAGEVDDLVTKFTRVEKRILDNGGLRYMSKTREAKSKIQAYRDRIKTAPPKWSGMFAQVKVTTADLEKIYAFDEAQMRYVEDMAVKIEAIENALKADVDIEDALYDLEDKAAEANEAFQMRDDVLLQLDRK
jgi:dGTP triphosphohydrolase